MLSQLAKCYSSFKLTSTHNLLTLSSTFFTFSEGKDWSWRIRYAAILGLVKITRCSQDTLHEGLRTVAWNALMRCHTKERDERVLEAFRVGQVCRSLYVF